MAAVVTPCAASGAAVTSASASGRSVGPLTLWPQQLFERWIVVERLEARIGMEGSDRLLPEFAGQPQSLLVCLGDQAHGSRSVTQQRGDAGAPVGGEPLEERARACSEDTVSLRRLRSIAALRREGAPNALIGQAVWLFAHELLSEHLRRFPAPGCVQRLEAQPSGAFAASLFHGPPVEPRAAPRVDGVARGALPVCPQLHGPLPDHDSRGPQQLRPSRL